MATVANIVRAIWLWIVSFPDAAATLLVLVVEHPDPVIQISGLVFAFMVWIFTEVAKDLLKSAVLLLLRWYVWPKLPARLRSWLLKWRGRLLLRNSELDGSERASESLEEMRAKRQLGRLEARLELAEKALSTMQKERDQLLREPEEEREERRA